MKPNALTLLLFVPLLLPGCQGSENDNSASSGINDVKSAPQPEIDSMDKYLADFSKFIDDIVNAVEPVSDEETATEALAKLKQLERRAKALGKRVEHFKAAANESGANDEVVDFLQEHGKTKLAARFKRLEERLGKSKTSSKYPKLWELAVSLINTAKSN